MRFSFTVAGKFAVLLVVFLALQVVQLGVGIQRVLHVSEEAESMSGVGKARPAVFAEFARRLLASGAAQPALQQELLDALAAQERTYRQLAARIGNKGTDREYAELARSVIGAHDTWQRDLKPLIQSFDPARPEHLRETLARYEALFPIQAGRLAKIVALLEQHLREEIRLSIYVHVFVFVLSMLLALLALLMVRRQITAPLRAQVEAARAMADGSYDRRLVVSAGDEIGVLADTFNRMAEAVAERTGQLSALNQVATAIASSLQIQDILDEIMRRGVALTGAKAACIAFYDEATGRFTNWVSRGLSEHFVRNLVFRPGGLADEAFTSGTCILSNDRPQTKHRLSELARKEGLRSFVCLALTSRDRRLGVIYFYRTDRDTFAPAEIELLHTFASLAAQAIENARLFAQAQDQARTDTLTGLCNRREFERRLREEVERSRRYGRPLSLLLLDVDHFKVINDTHGHLVGDEVLRAAAGRIRQVLRPIDQAARYGGEEFAMILPETEGAGACALAERIRAAIAAQPFATGGAPSVDLTVSIGIATCPEHADRDQALLAAADQALYAAKQTGRNRVCTHRNAQ